MNELHDARKNLEQSLGEELKKQYFGLLKQWFLFSGSITKMQFDASVRKLMTSEQQLRCHNKFLLAFYNKINNTRVRELQNTIEEGTFEMADFTQYYPLSSSVFVLPTEIESRSAAAELFLPDSTFISARITVHSWENGLKGADDGVTEVVVQACQNFIRNIVTAMISKKQGYKIYDRKFQCDFGLPVSDPCVRNASRILDLPYDSKVDVSNTDDNFIPSCKPSLENAEQQVAFEYLCGKRKYSDGKLTMKLLYDTLRDNPNIVGLNSVHSVNLLKIGLTIDE